MTRLYREITIWRTVRNGLAIRYTCFERLGTAEFSVHIADFIRMPLDATTLQQQARNRIELLLEDQLTAKTWHTTVEAALAAHDADFDNRFE